MPEVIAPATLNGTEIKKFTQPIVSIIRPLTAEATTRGKAVMAVKSAN